MSGWKIDDQEWMDNREKDWNRIESILRYEVESKNELKQLRTYFLTGKLAKKSIVELFHQLWMHPDQNEDTWQRIIDPVEFEDFRRALKRIVDESRTGYMNGIDGPLVRFLLGPDQEKGVIRFKDMIVNVEDFWPGTFFDHWRRRAFIWLKEPYDVDDCFCPYSIDFFFHLLPHVPEEYFGLVHYDPSDDKNDSALKSLRLQIRQTHKLLFYIAWFVEPRGLNDENTNVKRFSETMKGELDRRELPPHIKRLWEFIKNGEDLSLMRRDEVYFIDYKPPVLHCAKHIDSPLTLLRKVHHVYTDLGYTDEAFAQDTLDTIELKGCLSEEFIDLLGYNGQNSIPAYRYRLNTNAAYVNNLSERIDLDIIIFTHQSGIEWTDKTPVAMLLPRPADKYDMSDFSQTYQHSVYNLNFSLVRRTLAAQYGVEFRCYVNSYGDEREKLFFEPLVLEVPYFPLDEDLLVLLTNSDEDFPILKDSSLPPLV